MAHVQPYAYATQGLENKYQYNGKEMNGDFGLDWMDYGARFYDGGLGRWLSVDPLADKYYGWSGYNYVLGNPLIYTDPDGMQVINGHAKDLDEINKKVGNLLEKKENFNGGKKELRTLNREIRKSKREQSNIQADFDSAELAIKEFSTVSPSDFAQLDNLKDGGGNVVDVFVESAPELRSNDSQNLLGKTDVLPLQDYMVTDTKGSTYWYSTVYSKNGKNTATIQIKSNSFNDGSLGGTLAHEAGHTIYNVPNMLTYLRWLKNNPGQAGGHGLGNPSGEAADKMENRYNQNKN